MALPMTEAVTPLWLDVAASEVSFSCVEMCHNCLPTTYETTGQMLCRKKGEALQDA